MHLEIITPEYVVFNDEIDAVTLPGKDGEFQILNNHAPIVATLGEGIVKIKVQNKTLKDFDNESGKVYSSSDESILLVDIKGGTIEMNNNKVIVLAN